MSALRFSPNHYRIAMPHELVDYSKPRAQRDTERTARRANYERLLAWCKANKVPTSGYLNKLKAEKALAAAKKSLDFPLEVQELFYMGF